MRDYFDHNATSPLRDAARRAIDRALSAPAGNASSIHEEGRAARALLDAARADVAQLASVSPRDVVFTSGGSEAIAAAIRGIADRAPRDRRRVVVSSIEHSSVLEGVRALAAHGFEVVEVPCEASGRVDETSFAGAIDDRTALACLQAANNETGVIQPVEMAGAACRNRGVPFLVDAIQAAGKIPIAIDRWRADVVAISSHKLGGPQGAGALIVREGTKMAPLVAGGAQERRRRGGTEAVAMIAGFGAACAEAMERLDEEAIRVTTLRDRIEHEFGEIDPNVRIHGAEAPRLSNTVHAAFPAVSGETLVIALDLAGFAVSNGSACASGAVTPSHVMRAMGLTEEESRAGIRISLGWSTTEAAVDRFLAAIPELVRRATMARS